MSSSAMRLILGTLMLLPVGCGSGPTLIPVEGKLTVQNKVLSHARLQFVPDASKGNTSLLEARGRVDENGVYQLMTGDKPGCAPGWYKVLVYAMKEPKPGEGPSPPVWLASMLYTSEQTTPLSVEVTANAQPGQYDFDLKP